MLAIWYNVQRIYFTRTALNKFNYVYWTHKIVFNYIKLNSFKISFIKGDTLKVFENLTSFVWRVTALIYLFFKDILQKEIEYIFIVHNLCREIRENCIFYNQCNSFHGSLVLFYRSLQFHSCFNKLNGLKIWTTFSHQMNCHIKLYS